MILEIDAGNTRIKWRLLAVHNISVTNDIGVTGEVIQAGVINEVERLADLLKDVSHIRLASVTNQDVLDVVRQQLDASQSCFIARSEKHAAGVTNSYHDPSRMGVDRWLAMLAAFNQSQQAVCVIDCGSAITVDYILDDGRHAGGYIVPGLAMLEASLLQQTSNIIVADDNVVDKNAVTWGQSTEEAVKQGKLSLVSAWLRKISDELIAQNVIVYLCGGDALLVQPFLSSVIKYQPTLVLDGLVYAELGAK